MRNLLVAALALVTLCSCSGSSSAKPPLPAPASSTAAPTPASTSSPAAATKAKTAAPSAPTTTAAHTLAVTLAPWQLPTPLSREIGLAAPGGGIELLGGLLNGDRSSSQVLRIALPGGAVRSDGSLAIGVHDSAGAVVHGRVFVYGGGAAREVASIQQAVVGAMATVAGALPAPRSDLVAVTTPKGVVVLGGYDGTHTLADVLATRDGVHFTVLSRLPVPVRYPGVLLRGNGILVYGGDVDRRPVDVVQRVDLVTGRTTVVGHLPLPLSHEAAFTLGGAYWLVGGTSSGGTTAKIYRSTDGVTFTPAGRLPAPRSDAAAVVVDGVGYLLGGEAATRMSTVYELRPHG